VRRQPRHEAFQRAPAFYLLPLPDRHSLISVADAHLHRGCDKRLIGFLLEACKSPDLLRDLKLPLDAGPGHQPAGGALKLRLGLTDDRRSRRVDAP
jgi:hypothetical protein